MKNWFKKVGGYLAGGFCLLISAGILGASVLVANAGEIFFCAMVSTLPLYTGIMSIREQRERNKTIFSPPIVENYVRDVDKENCFEQHISKSRECAHEKGKQINDFNQDNNLTL